MDGESAQKPERPVNVMLLASSLWIGGAEAVIQHLALSLDRSRFRVLVCYLKDRGHIGDMIAEAGVNIVGVRRPGDSPVDYLSFLKLWRIIRDAGIDVVHSHTTHGLTDACLCKIFRPRLRVVHTFHFGNYPHTRMKHIWLERIFSRIADRLVAVGEFQRRQIVAVHRVAPRRICVIHNGVSLPGRANGTSLRQRLGAGERIIVGTIATMIPQKGLADLLTVAKSIKDSGRNVLFVIVGEGHLRLGLELERRRLGLEDTVVLTGWITDAAAHALPAFDIFFQPSLWEAMSVVILEAMAAGLPIVATRVGENPAVLEEGLTGFLVPPGDTVAMSVVLRNLIDDPALRERLGKAARRAVERKFTVDHMARSYQQVYGEMIR